MNAGARVSFSWLTGPAADPKTVRHNGTGVVVSFPDPFHALVAVDPEIDGAPHQVIHCTLTWLTVLP